MDVWAAAPNAGGVHAPSRKSWMRPSAPAPNPAAQVVPTVRLPHPSSRSPPPEFRSFALAMARCIRPAGLLDGAFSFRKILNQGTNRLGQERFNAGRPEGH